MTLWIYSALGPRSEKFSHVAAVKASSKEQALERLRKEYPGIAKWRLIGRIEVDYLVA
jgi:hypothetical protein